MAIIRDSKNEPMTIANSASQSTEVVDMRDFAGGMIRVPGAWTAADIGFLVCDTEGGTFVDLLDAEGSRVKITGVPTGASAYLVLPDGLFAARYMKLESIDTSDESAEAQGAERSLMLTLKS